MKDPQADFRTTKAAVKAHTIVDLRGAIPVFVHITTGKVHDVKVLDLIHWPPEQQHLGRATKMYSIYRSLLGPLRVPSLTKPYPDLREH